MRGLTVKASELMETMDAIIKYPRANYFEPAYALSFVSGRGLSELVGTSVQFSPSGTDSPHEAGIELSEGPIGHSSFRIPLLCDFNHFIEGFDRLRATKSASHLTPAEINQRYSKSANRYARKLHSAGAEGFILSDFKTLHAAVTRRVFRGHGLSCLW